MTQQVHLERGLLGIHRLRGEALALRDARPVTDLLVEVVVGAHAVAVHAGRCRDAHGCGDAAFLDARELMLHLVDREVERGFGLDRRRVPLHEVLLEVHRDLTRAGAREHAVF